MQPGHDLALARELARAELPAFALRHGPDLQKALPHWHFTRHPDEPFRSGGCGVFALALRRWSRARLSVLALPGEESGRVLHLFAALPGSGAGCGVWDANPDPDDPAWQLVVPVSALPRLRQYRSWRSWPAMAAFVGQLADMMDEELGPGGELFSDLPPLPIDGSSLL